MGQGGLKTDCRMQIGGKKTCLGPEGPNLLNTKTGFDLHPRKAFQAQQENKNIRVKHKGNSPSKLEEASSVAYANKREFRFHLGKTFMSVLRFVSPLLIRFCFVALLLFNSGSQLQWWMTKSEELLCVLLMKACTSVSKNKDDC